MARKQTTCLIAVSKNIFESAISQVEIHPPVIFVVFLSEIQHTS